MLESGKNSFIPKKSFEVAYALFRIAANTTDMGFAGMLREEATRLVANAAKENYSEAAKSIAAIEYFVRLATEAGFISFSNAEIILHELGNLNAAIAGLPNAAIQEVDLSGIFSNSHPAGEQKLFHHRKREQSGSENTSEDGSGIMKSEIRQTAIIERIRQSGNCRLKDIMELFPGSSERTLRYDLQSLVEQNLVERVGNGGPAVFYRIRQVQEA